MLCGTERPRTWIGQEAPRDLSRRLENPSSHLGAMAFACTYSYREHCAGGSRVWGQLGQDPASYKVKENKAVVTLSLDASTEWKEQNEPKVGRTKRCQSVEEWEMLAFFFLCWAWNLGPWLCSKSTLLSYFPGTLTLIQKVTANKWN